ncbi:hypothetical protein BD410DRAFT_166486 [Rickenella mellea]|uniref:Uncharacterized protein n=1 Tax=Rickenella mellea TaxID=50990 RepID=A0A4Y7PHR5_9AGAM|nr:hypothetical protein BD410DRAFT_166486 [Rickenella mellea]
MYHRRGKESFTSSYAPPFGSWRCVTWRYPSCYTLEATYGIAINEKTSQHQMHRSESCLTRVQRGSDTIRRNLAPSDVYGKPSPQRLCYRFQLNCAAKHSSCKRLKPGSFSIECIANTNVDGHSHLVLFPPQSPIELCTATLIMQVLDSASFSLHPHFSAIAN